MTRRSGMTLVEVLVAIFIMAIGLLALLTLFPLGALNMAQAIKDQRVAEAGRNAGAIADITFEQNVTYSTTATPPVTSAAPYQWTMRSDAVLADPTKGALMNPGGSLPSLSSSTLGPTYPVLVDPIGYQAYGSWVASNPPNYPGLPRRTMRILLPTTDPSGLNVDSNMNPSNPTYVTKQIYRWTTLLDDITFDENGVPDLTTGNVQREGRYSWAWLVQAPSVSGALASPPVVNLKVLVFNGRSLDLNSSLGAQEENSYLTYFGQDYTGTQTPRVINIQWANSQPRPNLTANSWVLDATMNPTPNAYFYRVLNVADTGTASNGNNQMDVEVQTDLKYVGQGYTIVFDKLVEVIDRLNY